MDETENWEFEKTMVVSTCHMTRNDDCLLADAGRVCLCNSYEGGYLIHIPVEGEHIEDSLVSHVMKQGLSHSLALVMAKAQSLGCQWVKVDRDGPKYKCFTEYEW